MRGFLPLLYCFYFLVLVLPACQQFRQATGRQYHRTSATAIANSELVGDTEIDTGRYVLLAYERYSNRPHHSDSWFAKNVYIKVHSPDEFPLQREVAIPRPGVTISTYSLGSLHQTRS